MITVKYGLKLRDGKLWNSKNDYSETDLSRCLFCKYTGNVKSLKLLLQENLFKNKWIMKKNVKYSTLFVFQLEKLNLLFNK